MCRSDARMHGRLETQPLLLWGTDEVLWHGEVVRDSHVGILHSGLTTNQNVLVIL